jgi:phosphoesterase RecJ-like protein
VSRVDWKPLARHLRSAEKIVLGTHINADGDGLGSEIALHLFLRAIGKKSQIVNSEPVSEKYRFLKGSEVIEAYDPARHSVLIRSADIFIVLDNSSLERLARLRPDVEAARGVKACIDHHSAVNPFWNLSAVDTDACASGQLVLELIRYMGGEVTPEIAEALYVAFVTDTGHFRFSKTSPGAHRIVAELMEIGEIRPARVFGEIYERTTRGMAALTGLALGSLRFLYGGRFACMRMTQEQVRASDGEEEDTGDLANLPLTVKGVLAGALFREMPDGTIKVSLRSKGEIDVHALAAELRGGGHKNAAGVLMTMSLEEAERTVIKGMSRYFDRDDPSAAGAEGGLR